MSTDAGLARERRRAWTLLTTRIQNGSRGPIPGPTLDSVSIQERESKPQSYISVSLPISKPTPPPHACLGRPLVR